MKNLLLVLLLLPLTLLATQRHVTSTSTTRSGNALTEETAWPLSYALMDSGTVIQAGDTIWVHGGTYTLSGTQDCSLDGTAEAPIIFRNYNNERAILTTGLVSTNFILYIDNASYVWFWGLEFAASPTDRVQNPPVDAGAPRPNCDVPYGVYLHGNTMPGMKLINCVFHDVNENGVWQGCVDAEITGNILYNIGTFGTQGHSFYTQNAAGGRKRYTGNIIINEVPDGYGIHAYGSATRLDSITVSENVFVNATLLYGGASDTMHLYGAMVDSNNTFISGMDIGYHMAGVVNPLIRNNRLGMNHGVGSANMIIKVPTGGTVTGNLFAAKAYIRDVANAVSSPAFWSAYPNNVDISDSTYNELTVGDSTYLILNRYETGRAHLVSYNWDVGDSISATVTGVFENGTTVYVYNAANPYGNVAFEATVSGGSITVPMSSSRWTPATIAGAGDSAVTNTFPRFGAFILTGSPALPPDPVITETGTLSAFTAAKGGTSAEQTFTVSAIGLTEDLVVTAPAGFEVSKTTSTGFASSISFTPSSGTVGTSTVYVHYVPTEWGSSSGNISCTSTGATTQNVSVSGNAVAPMMLLKRN